MGKGDFVLPRLGVQFQKPPAAVQASLDRAVFGLIRRKADAKRPLQVAPGAERRLAPRAEINESDHLAVVQLPDRPRGALAARDKEKDKAVAGPALKLVDLSTTGCGLTCPEPCTLQAGQLIRLRLTGPNLDIELTGKILYRREAP